MMLVPLLIAAPAQGTVQGAAAIFVQGPDGVTKNMELKATKDSSGVKPVDGFALDADNVVSTPLNGKLRLFGDVSVQFTGAKLTPAATVDTLDIPIIDGQINLVGITEGVYTLDVIVDDKAYECIVVVGPVAQQVIINEITEINSQSSNVVKIFEKGKETPSEEELNVCYFKPNTDPHCKPVNGECPEDAPNMNDDGNCHPTGCPEGYSMLDDDETGTCYNDNNVTICPTSHAKVLDPDDCAIYEPDATPTPTPTPEPQALTEEPTVTPTPEPTEEPKDSICGGEPCTASEKEDSWLSDEPETEPPVTDSEKTVQEIEEKEEQDSEPEDEQPEQ